MAGMHIIVAVSIQSVKNPDVRLVGTQVQ